jgi:hypothetical protein
LAGFDAVIDVSGLVVFHRDRYTIAVEAYAGKSSLGVVGETIILKAHAVLDHQFVGVAAGKIDVIDRDAIECGIVDTGEFVARILVVIDVLDTGTALLD